MLALKARQATRKGQSMAASLERRVEALEAYKLQPWRWVWQHHDETADEAKQRADVQPCECVAVFSWLDIEL